jgi:hypothetical protein
MALSTTKATAQIFIVFVGNDDLNSEVFVNQFPHSRFFINKEFDAKLLLWLVEHLQRDPEKL